jgi:hypothetical protein
MSQRVTSSQVGGGTHGNEQRKRAPLNYQPEISLAKGIPMEHFKSGLVNPYLIPANFGGFAAPLELKANGHFGKVSPSNVTHRDFLNSILQLHSFAVASYQYKSLASQLLPSSLQFTLSCHLSPFVFTQSKSTSLRHSHG